jgi:hypothetical protein
LSGRIVTILLTAPQAWVDFSWELAQEERDDAKQISVILTINAPSADTGCWEKRDEHQAFFRQRVGVSIDGNATHLEPRDKLRKRSKL